MIDNRQDMLDALTMRVPKGQVPLWELSFDGWDAFSGEHMVLGEEMAALDAKGQTNAMYSNAEIILEVSELLGFNAVTTPNGYWQIAPGVLAYYILPGETRFEQVRILRDLAPDLVLVAGSGGVMAMPGAEEYVNFSYKLYDAPEEIDVRAKQTVLGGIENAKRLRDCGADVVLTSSDIADNHGLFFKPAHMERFILPYLRQWATAVREMGLYAILHSDGNLFAAIDDIADSGIHALQAVDPVAGMDMLTTKRSVAGRICLCGNVDCGLLVRGTPDQVYDSTRDLLVSCKQGGGLILGASNAVQMEVSTENYLALVKARQDFGAYT